MHGAPRGNLEQQLGELVFNLDFCKPAFDVVQIQQCGQRSIFTWVLTVGQACLFNNDASPTISSVCAATLVQPLVS